MKLEGISKRISLARESKTSHEEPYNDVYDKFVASIELWDFVENNKAEKRIRYEARKYVVITCVSCIEVFFKRMAMLFIDSGLIKDDFREILRKYSISLSDLLDIKKRKLSIGEIVAVSHSMQDLESINSCFNKILGIQNFLKELETIEVVPENKNKYILIQEYPDIWAKIAELLRLRHLIIHHEGFKRILGDERLLNMSLCVAAFISAADNYFRDNYFRNNMP